MKSVLIPTIFMKAANAVTKRFPKFASAHMNGFPRAADDDNFPKFLNTVCSSFLRLVSCGL